MSTTKREQRVAMREANAIRLQSLDARRREQEDRRADALHRAAEQMTPEQWAERIAEMRRLLKGRGR